MGPQDMRAVLGHFCTGIAGVDWSPGANGGPRLHGALATFEADPEFEHEAGDHTIAVAHVTTLEAHRGTPLLFYRGDYGGFADGQPDRSDTGVMTCP